MILQTFCVQQTTGYKVLICHPASAFGVLINNSPRFNHHSISHFTVELRWGDSHTLIFTRVFFFLCHSLFRRSIVSTISEYNWSIELLSIVSHNTIIFILTQLKTRSWSITFLQSTISINNCWSLHLRLLRLFRFYDRIILDINIHGISGCSDSW